VDILACLECSLPAEGEGHAVSFVAAGLDGDGLASSLHADLLAVRHGQAIAPCQGILPEFLFAVVAGANIAVSVAESRHFGDLFQTIGLDLFLSGGRFGRMLHCHWCCRRRGDISRQVDLVALISGFSSAFLGLVGLGACALVVGAISTGLEQAIPSALGPLAYHAGLKVSLTLAGGSGLALASADSQSLLSERLLEASALVDGILSALLVGITFAALLAGLALAISHEEFLGEDLWDGL